MYFSQFRYFFDQTLTQADSIKPKQIYALSRYDWLQGAWHLFNRPDSQDAWIFHTPVKITNANFNLGVGGCDNKVAYLINPQLILSN